MLCVCREKIGLNNVEVLAGLVTTGSESKPLQTSAIVARFFSLGARQTQIGFEC
jgi:hypothetical protein